jgi:hypothetical protein
MSKVKKKIFGEETTEKSIELLCYLMKWMHQNGKKEKK